MLHALLIGLSAGARSMTPLAVVANAAHNRTLPADNGAPSWLAHPLVSAGAKALAAGEIWGDKWRSAPDRIVLAGIAARLVTGGVSGMALAPRRRRVAGAVLGAGAAVAASYVTFALRMRAMRRFGQTSTGVIEDALTLGAAQTVALAARERRPG